MATLDAKMLVLAMLLWTCAEGMSLPQPHTLTSRDPAGGRSGGSRGFSGGGTGSSSDPRKKRNKTIGIAVGVVVGVIVLVVLLWVAWRKKQVRERNAVAAREKEGVRNREVVV
ncbi:hypothetical protein ACN47E_004399 [Coniothyrium glycines]